MPGALTRKWWWAILGIGLLWPMATHAQPRVISEISLLSPGSGTRVPLPYFVKQEHSGPGEKIWTFEIPSELGAALLPTLLLPQPIQGAQIRIGQQVIHEFPGSDAQALRNWYRPILVSIPSQALPTGQSVTVTVHQKGHLRGWFISPILAGELQVLRPLYEQYTFISQTLSTTINALSALAGVFLLYIGLRTHSRAYQYSGLGTLCWSVLFSLALASEIPTDLWYVWRLLVYAITGLLIYFISLFMLEIFQQPPAPPLRFALFLFLNLAWVLFAIGGRRVETMLDIAWTGLAICIYIATSAWAIAHALRSPRQQGMVLPIAAHWLITSVLAAHDYTLQAGWLPLNIPTAPTELWASIALQPIYLTHLALPAFVIMAMWLLVQDHLQKNRNEIEHAHRLHAQRERIVRDIHDGVGSRINLLLWSLRSQQSPPSHIESELQRCMDELRFAINPTHTGSDTLHQSLSTLCERLQEQCQQRGVVLQYIHHGQYAPISSDIGLQLYKAVQECLSNALRHSQARKISIEWTQHSESLELVIRDNGQGIPGWNNAEQIQNASAPTSLGLRSLQSRIRSKGGRLHIHSDMHGTAIQIEMPLSEGDAGSPAA